MNSANAYREWKSLFDEDVSKIWQEESNKELKRISMILFTVKREFNKITEILDNGVVNLRKNLIDAQTNQNVAKAMAFESTDATNFNKENFKAKTHAINSITLNLVDSPEIFLNADVSTSQESSIIISDDDLANTARFGDSPEIKKKRKNPFSKRRQKLKERNFFKDLDGNKKAGCLREKKTNFDNKTQFSSEKSSSFFKDVLCSDTRPNKEGKSAEDDLLQNNDEQIGKITESKEMNTVSTPLKSENDIIDLSVIQCTPVQKIDLPKRKEKLSSFQQKNKSHKNKSSTITQMFLSHKNTDKDRDSNSSKFEKKSYDSDATYFDHENRGKSSVMSITRMVSYINKESTLKDDDNTIEKDDAALEGDGSFETERSKRFNRGISSGNNTTAVDKSLENIKVKKGLNEFFAVAQNVPDYQLEAAPIVRGKARQNLPGWSCKDCEKFYVNQGLNPDELMALNKCSRHRGKFRPREDTLPGFWDMNMVTQESQNTK